MLCIIFSYLFPQNKYLLLWLFKMSQIVDDVEFWVVRCIPRVHVEGAERHNIQGLETVSSKLVIFCYTYTYKCKE